MARWLQRGRGGQRPELMDAESGGTAVLSPSRSGLDDSVPESRSPRTLASDSYAAPKHGCALQQDHPPTRQLTAPAIVAGAPVDAASGRGAHVGASLRERWCASGCDGGTQGARAQQLRQGDRTARDARSASCRAASRSRAASRRRSGQPSSADDDAEGQDRAAPDAPGRRLVGVGLDAHSVRHEERSRRLRGIGRQLDVPAGRHAAAAGRAAARS